MCGLGFLLFGLQFSYITRDYLALATETIVLNYSYV